MIRIILSGCNGRMGRVITECVSERDDCMIVAGIDINADMNAGFPVFKSAAECLAGADVIIDFSHPSLLCPLIDLALSRRIAAVICTTGMDAGHTACIREASKSIPMFFSANMSLGVNLMSELAKTAARILGRNYDIEIVEKHHNQKVDAPSGTALKLADEISSALPQHPQYVYDRHSQRARRSKNEIGLHAIRGGTIIGEHEIIFAGRDEVLTISHSAASKEVFATGAISAALFISGKAPGLYTMSDLIGKTSYKKSRVK